MSERQRQPMDEPDSVEPKAEWTRPEVDRLLTAGAEGTDGADVDAADLLS